MSTSADARLKVLWPETYSGNGGVTKSSFWYGLQVSPRINAVPTFGPPQARISRPENRNRIAVAGRMKS